MTTLILEQKCGKTYLILDIIVQNVSKIQVTDFELNFYYLNGILDTYPKTEVLNWDIIVKILDDFLND
jgi:hypothetical protein